MFQDNGRIRKALVIGLNYKHCAVSGLNGCINDTVKVTKFLKEHNFTQDDITVATDNEGSWGTRQDILDEVDKHGFEGLVVIELLEKKAFVIIVRKLV